LAFCPRLSINSNFSRGNGIAGKVTGGKAMPLTKKGKKIKRAMQEQYGKDKGEKVFYASQNKGNIKGTEKKQRRGLMNA
jgi:hypothetical protein